jgi:hypothetical protein
MSADNWARCPRCAARRTVELERERAKVSELYGKVPVEQFDAARRAFDTAIADEQRAIGHTFREDYEIFGADTGTVTVRYSGNCRMCSLTLNFIQDYPIPDWDKP